MAIEKYSDMNLQELDIMKEIGSIGTSHAATSLSKMLQKEVRITIPRVSVLNYQTALDQTGDPEEIVAATLVKMDGDVDGLMLFLFNLRFANRILEKFMGKTYEGLESLDELGASALTEVGNIIICSYINAFSQLAGMNIQLSVPSFTVNMLGGILTVPMTECGNDTDQLMYFDADFLIEGEKMNDWLLMLADIASLNRILSKLGVS